MVIGIYDSICQTICYKSLKLFSYKINNNLHNFRSRKPTIVIKQQKKLFGSIAATILKSDVFKIQLLASFYNQRLKYYYIIISWGVHHYYVVPRSLEFKQRCRGIKSSKLLNFIQELVLVLSIYLTKKSYMLNVYTTKSYQDIAPISLSRLYSDSSLGILDIQHGKPTPIFFIKI